MRNGSLAPFETEIRFARNNMATTFELRIVCAKASIRHAQSVLQESFLIIENLENKLSEFRVHTSVAQFNAAAPGTWVSLDPEVIALLSRSVQIARETNGAFNPWAKSTPAPEHPSSAFELDGSRARKWIAGLHLSFGAIGKGLALDRVAALLAREGFENFLLSAGGSSILLSGYGPRGLPWKWSWALSMAENAAHFAHTSGKRMALGISGLYEKGNHIRGIQAGQAPITTLVAHSSAAEADALSTALFVNPKITPQAQSWAVIHRDRALQWGGVLLSSVASSLSARAQEINLDDLNSGPVSNFHPYITERSDFWMLLPLVSLVMLALHLRLIKHPRRRKGDAS